MLVSSPGAPVLLDATPAPRRSAGARAQLTPVTGRIALHGGGEFLPGDETFLDALLRAAADGAGERGHRGAVSVVVVPTAAARGRPDLAAAHGVEAFRARGAATGIEVDVDTVRVVDGESADDEALAGRIASADLVYFPGGDPDLIPAMMAGSAAGDALRQTYEAGGVIGGASAGAMALAEWTWTPRGGVHGLGFVRGLAVFPHYDESVRRRWQANLAGVAPADIGYLGLDERTGVISDGGAWVVAGEGAAHWIAPDSEDPVVVEHGERIRLP
jgi:cyanophycinase-like exopeptidase